ncbi:MAG: hypothetical protein QM791_04185 [Ferruginibacter sp.]
MEPDHLREDLRQEVILVICELPEEKLLQLHADKVLEFFTVRIILNQVKSNTSPFTKKYRKMNAGYVENFMDRDKLEELANGELAIIEAMGIRNQVKAVVSTHLDHFRRMEQEEMEDRAIAEISNLYWYNKELITLYAKHLNYRAIEQETGIPWQSCYKTIKKSFEEIKKKIANEAA